MSENPLKILIVGGGIGGLALAVALQKVGLTAVIWERSPEIREIGAGLLLTPNAVWVLQQLGLFELTSNLGQGAAMALEDASVLAKCLQASGCNHAALEQYERIRKSRASFVVWQSRQVGKMIQLEHPVLTAARDGVLRLMPDWIGVRALSPIFNFRA